MIPNPRAAGQTERAPRERVTVAVIRKPQGRHGEVLATILSDFPENLLKRQRVLLWDGNESTLGREVTVSRAWFHKTGIVFQFERFTDRADAEKVRGWHVQIPRTERVELPPGSYYISDLVGCEVFEQTVDGAKMLGQVRHVISTGEGLGGPHLLEVGTEQGDILIPLVQEICPKIEVAARHIEVTLPEGLRDLNRKQ